jgi:3-dehydroquinate synthetase
VRAALQRWGLPVTCEAAPEAVLHALRHDKKRRAGGLLFVLPDAPGSLRLLRDPPRDAVLAALAAVRAPG